MTPSCPICNDEMCIEKDKSNASVVYCADCSTPHHLDCYQSTQKCAIYGCGGKNIAFSLEQNLGRNTQNLPAIRETQLVSQGQLVPEESIEALIQYIPQDDLSREIPLETILDVYDQKDKFDIIEGYRDYLDKRTNCISRYHNGNNPVHVPDSKKVKELENSYAVFGSLAGMCFGLTPLLAYYTGYSPRSIGEVILDSVMLSFAFGTLGVAYGAIIGRSIGDEVAEISTDPKEVKRRKLQEAHDQWEENNKRKMNEELKQINIKYAQKLLPKV